MVSSCEKKKTVKKSDDKGADVQEGEYFEKEKETKEEEEEEEEESSVMTRGIPIKVNEEVHQRLKKVNELIEMAVEEHNEAKLSGKLNETVSTIDIARFYVRKSVLHNCLGDYEAAILAVKVALEYNPQCAGAYHRLGQALYCLNRFQVALRCFERAIVLDPSAKDAEDAYKLCINRIKSKKDRKSLYLT